MNKNLIFALIPSLFGCTTPCEQSVQDMKTCLEEFDKAYPEAETDTNVDAEECLEQDEIPTEYFECISTAAERADCSTEEGFLTFFLEVWDCAEQYGILEEDSSSNPEEPIEEDSYEPDNTIETATTFTVGESQERTLHDSDDTDFVTFTATAGTTYILETFIDSTAETDTNLVLYNSDTFMLAENDDNINLESLIEWTADVDGTYVLEIQSYYQGPYTLQITAN